MKKILLATALTLAMSAGQSQALMITFDYQVPTDGSGKTSRYVNADNTAKAYTAIETFDAPKLSDGSYALPAYAASGWVTRSDLSVGYYVDVKTDVVGVTKQVWVPQGAGFNSLDPTTDIIIKEGSFAIQKLGTAGVAANPANDTTFFAFTPEPGGAVTTEIEIDYKQYLAGTGLRIWGLGFYYGSIDDYNYLKFFAEDGSLITATTGVLSDGILSGDEIRTGPNGSWTAPGSNLYVNLWFAANDPVFKSFSFSTTRVAFEGDNFAAIFHEVPEPTTMLLFGAGLAGLAGFRRKRSK